MAGNSVIINNINKTHCYKSTANVRLTLTTTIQSIKILFDISPYNKKRERTLNLSTVSEFLLNPLSTMPIKQRQVVVCALQVLI